MTHLIAGKINTVKYKYVAMYRMDVKIMHLDWIFDIYQQWLQGDDIDFLEFEKKHYLPPFYNLLICVTNVPIEQRVEMEQKIIYLGGKYTPDLTKNTTHLIASHASGKKYEFGIKWGIKIITPEWFWQSIKRGACLEECLFSLEMMPNEIGKGAWFPMQENEKEEDKQVFLKKKIKKIKRDLSHEIWDNIVNENHDLRNDVPTELNNSMLINTTQDTEDSKSNGMFWGFYFYAWAFDNRKTEILENIIKSHDGIWCKTIHDFPDEPVHIYIIVSHDLLRSNFPDISRGFFVTEWWIERCLHSKKMINPSEDLLCTPFPFNFPLEDMKGLSICLTGFSAIDLMHISKLISLLGANYYESLNKKRNLLIYNTKSEKSKKYTKAKEWNIKTVPQDWLWEVVMQGKVIDFDEWGKKMEVNDQLNVETNFFDNPEPEILSGFTLYFHNMKEKDCMNEMLILTQKLGGKISNKLDDSVTHVVCDESLLNMDERLHISQKYKVMSPKWLLECQNQTRNSDKYDSHNVQNACGEINNHCYEDSVNIEKNNHPQVANIDYLVDLLKKQDNMFERKKKEKIKGRSTSLSIISTNIPIISNMQKNSEIFNEDKYKTVQSEYVKYEDYDALYEKKQVLEKLNKI